MLKNYFKVALRNLWKSKGFTLINIVGLASGLAVCLMIVLYVTHELSYDRYNDKADRIYRLDAEIYFNNTLFNSATSPKPLPVTLVRECPQVVQMTRVSFFNSQDEVLIKKGADWIKDRHLAFVDSTFFQVFTVQMVAGDPATALKEPHSIVLDESAAKRYFNTTDVVGKTLELQDKNICKVTGVIRDMPGNGHFHFSFLRTIRDSWMGDEQKWLSNGVVSYILVKPGTDRAFLQSRVDAAVNTYLLSQLKSDFHISPEEMKKGGNYFKYHLMPLMDIHLRSNKSYELEPNGNIAYVYVFSFIAILILVIACVNFMNLSTARSANRAREVGIRKVAGSSKRQLVIQFLVESVVVSLMSMVLALGLALVLLPMFNMLAGKELHGSMIFSGRFLSVLLLLVVVVGCLAGSYPAFYLSSFEPIKVLKGSIAAGFKSSWLRGSLVVFQFFISIGLIISTFVIYNQLNYIRSRQVGFDRDQVLVIHNASSAGDGIGSLRKELMKLSGVADVTVSGDMPTRGGGYNQNSWFLSPVMDAKAAAVFTQIYIDDHYIPTLGMQMAQGRNFSASFPSDSGAVLVNEATVRLLGWKDPLKESLYQGADGTMKPIAHRVIGVVKDFNFSSMHEKVGPMVMVLSDSRGSMAVRLRPGDIFSRVRQVEGQWKVAAPGLPFSYTFMENDFNNLYHAEAQTGRLFVTFALFAIFIACLGLFGLVTYAAEQRTKEIGIRKVLGAKVGGIVSLLSKDFTRLVLIAAVIAFPVTWWAMSRWLESFAYRITISWWIFPVAGLMAIGIVLVTVSIQTIRAALANPIRSLRSQ